MDKQRKAAQDVIKSLQDSAKIENTLPAPAPRPLCLPCLAFSAPPGSPVAPAVEPSAAPVVPGRQNNQHGALRETQRWRYRPWHHWQPGGYQSAQGRLPDLGLESFPAAWSRTSFPPPAKSRNRRKSSRFSSPTDPPCCRRWRPWPPRIGPRTHHPESRDDFPGGDPPRLRVSFTNATPSFSMRPSRAVAMPRAAGQITFFIGGDAAAWRKPARSWKSTPAPSCPIGEIGQASAIKIATQSHWRLSRWSPTPRPSAWSRKAASRSYKLGEALQHHAVRSPLCDLEDSADDHAVTLRPGFPLPAHVQGHPDRPFHGGGTRFGIAPPLPPWPARPCLACKTAGVMSDFSTIARHYGLLESRE